MRNATLAAKAPVPGEYGLRREEVMAARRSLFALAATACLVASSPASAVLIDYVVDPDLTLCVNASGFSTDPCQDISVSGKFTANIVPIPNSMDELHIDFPTVDIMLSDSSGNILPRSPVTLDRATAAMAGTDRLNFDASEHDCTLPNFMTKPFCPVSANFEIRFTPPVDLTTGGHLPLLETTSITVPTDSSATNTLYFTISISPQNGGFTSVPEPSSLVAMVSAMGLLGLVGWRRKSK